MHIGTYRNQTPYITSLGSIIDTIRILINYTKLSLHYRYIEYKHTIYCKLHLSYGAFCTIFRYEKLCRTGWVYRRGIT